jgi:hypothetical protein
LELGIDYNIDHGDNGNPRRIVGIWTSVPSLRLSTSSFCDEQNYFNVSLAGASETKPTPTTSFSWSHVYPPFSCLVSGRKKDGIDVVVILIVDIQAKSRPSPHQVGRECPDSNDQEFGVAVDGTGWFGMVGWQ